MGRKQERKRGVGWKRGSIGEVNESRGMEVYRVSKGNANGGNI